MHKMSYSIINECSNWIESMKKITLADKCIRWNVYAECTVWICPENNKVNYNNEKKW